MKFAIKYETLKRVANGRVETFVARDRQSNQQVTVHTFEYAKQGNSPSTMPDLLRAFSLLAPAPVGPIIDAGMFEGTTFAYIVTSWVSDEALEAWVRSFQGATTPKTEPTDPSDPATVIFAPSQVSRPAAPKTANSEQSEPATL